MADRLGKGLSYSSLNRQIRRGVAEDIRTLILCTDQQPAANYALHVLPFSEANVVSNTPSLILSDASITQNKETEKFQSTTLSSEPLSAINMDITETNSVAISDGLESDMFNVYSDTSDSDSTASCSNNLPESIAQWANQYGVAHSAIDALLKILQPFHNDLPSTARTLFGTVRSSSIKPISGGEYCHFGIANGIQEHFKCYGPVPDGTVNIDLQINIDGLPLFKSSQMQVWPILCCINQMLPKDPFVIGIFSGKSKPCSLDEYLEMFVDETILLQKNGLSIAGHLYNINIDSFICDAPARAFVKNIKGHSGYFGCDKCTQEGEYHNKMTFPDINAPLRTDVAFNELEQEEHHKGSTPLSKLSLGMVSQFPLDYMHLVCLGVVKRLICAWIKGPLKMRLPSRQTQSISDRLIQCAAHVPREFARKPRSLSDVDRWKATEFRQFLLYSGPVVLQGILSDVLYKHFLLLCVGISILCSPQLSVDLCQYAQELLVAFVQDVLNIYGVDMMVYNVHSLVHLANDSRRFGSVDNFSAFAYENKLKNLKQLVRKPQFPLAQLDRRIREGTRFKNRSHKNQTEFIVSRSHNNGPYPHGLCNVQQYKQVKSQEMFLSLSISDNVVITDHRIPVRVVNIVTIDGVAMIVYEEFRNISNFFEYPLNSSDLDIFKVSQLSGTLSTMPIVNVKRKCICLPCFSDGEAYIIFPLLHSRV